jgi:iron complex transport system ATP-binding protein
VSALLVAENLSLAHSRGKTPVVHALELEVRRGEVLALVGPNASGKSTTLAALGRELRPLSGRVTLDGRDVFAHGRRSFARRVARLPQEPVCIAGLRVEALVRCGRFPHASALRAPSAADLAPVERALERTGTAELRERRVDTLSGGERRRAWIAMVLAQDADVLLLDEPCAGLDLLHRLQLLELLRAQTRERGSSVVCAIHELEDAARFADRVAVIAGGRLLHCGPPSEALTPRILRAAFGVEAELRWERGLPSLRVTGASTPADLIQAEVPTHLRPA